MGVPCPKLVLKAKAFILGVQLHICVVLKSLQELYVDGSIKGCLNQLMQILEVEHLQSVCLEILGQYPTPRGIEAINQEVQWEKHIGKA